MEYPTFSNGVATSKSLTWVCTRSKHLLESHCVYISSKRAFKDATLGIRSFESRPSNYQVVREVWRMDE